MGIRFACHSCGKHLNIKIELAGKRGICPACSTRFRIPHSDSETSTPVEEKRKMATPSSPNVRGTATAEAETPSTSTSGAVAGDSNTSSSPVNLSTLDLLTSDPNATWYVRPPTGGQYGPANGEILKQWIGEGRVSATALLWRDGWPQWREASEALPELLGKLPELESEAATDPASASTSNKTTATSPHSTTSTTATATRHANTSVSAAHSTQERAKISGDNFGYEDSDFANGKSYGGEINSARLVGRDKVGKERRQRSSKRTSSIILLAVVAVVLILALLVVMIAL